VTSPPGEAGSEARHKQRLAWQAYPEPTLPYVG
jgi:hypothetical protein